jgi:hypothetical protein
MFLSQLPSAFILREDFNLKRILWGHSYSTTGAEKSLMYLLGSDESLLKQVWARTCAWGQEPHPPWALPSITQA